MLHARLLCLTIAAATLPALSPTAQAAEPSVGASYGPEPDWERFRELAETAVRNRLIDPDSAKFDWPHGFVKRGYTPFWSKRIYGYTTCALVNSKNRMGGYTGSAMFTVVIDNDQVLYTEIGSPKGTDLMTSACLKAGLPPLPDVATTIASAPSKNNYGFTVTAVPDGAYIASVTPACEKAGLHSGMVITSFNGIGLKGLTAAVMSQIIGAATGPATLQFAGGTSVRIEPAATVTPRLEYAQ
ncbi:PDZ domain-containing protein [Sphingomonas montanisoli]|uniref:PDZ domain-containing protein n=1 Tax=Sphingomonas montanisoli TaxID=2606412 RepID=A0A5D9C6S9_9SPHN|nr:PDZ domain-containing protein [Sphingomonas montanisoli]TZG25721.1 hypothetical protein FYJ91_11975 [Sphingomonas montanisoli]